MTAINENLKMIRKSKGLRQEDVARELGVTRQIISSYESNRTQADIETLKQLAIIYDVEFNDILYGKNKMQIKHKTIKIIATLSIIVLFFCNLVQSIILWLLNNYFIVESGDITNSFHSIINVRMSALNIRSAIGGLSSFSFRLLSIILFLLIITLERPIGTSSKLKYLAILIIASVITILPWSFFDAIYTLFDYSYTAILNLVFAIILLGLTFVGEYIVRLYRAKLEA